MYDVRIELRNLAEKAKVLHLRERQISLESVALVGELERRNAAVNMNMTSERFAAFIELTPNQYWKRAQAARVIRFFPQALEMAKAGETQVSHLALISPKITQANADLLLAGIKGKSKREVEGLLSQVTADGRILDKEPEVELRIKLTKSQLEILDRAREVLSHGGHVPSLPEVMIKALGDLLERRDPLRKAERAAVRKEKSGVASLGKEGGQSFAVESKAPSPGKEGGQSFAVESKAPSPGKEGGQWSAVESKAPSPGKEGGQSSAGEPKAPSPRMEGGQRSAVGAKAPSPGKEREQTTPKVPPRASAGKSARPAVPAAERHAVWLRDGGRCTWQHPDGGRCDERSMLELDHIEMWCHGGRHEADNLTLRCRRHNQFAAERELGVEFMARARASNQTF